MRFVIQITFLLSLTMAVNYSELSFVEKVRVVEAGVSNEKWINMFLNDPTNYNFLCTEESVGEVLSASLNKNGQLLIVYSSFWPDGDHSGKVMGTYDVNSNKFIGEYKTNDGRFSGEVNFSFNNNGEAYGTWDHGYGIIKIPLKKKYVK